MINLDPHESDSSNGDSIPDDEMSNMPLPRDVDQSSGQNKSIINKSQRLRTGSHRSLTKVKKARFVSQSLDQK